MIFNEHDMVSAAIDIKREGVTIKKGDRGTIVHIVIPRKTYIVEFPRENTSEVVTVFHKELYRLPTVKRKIFCIIEYFPAGGGHKICVIKNVADKQEAIEAYEEATRRILPPGIDIVEVTEKVTEVLQYDNPNYRG